ncbi:MAG TPA: M20/M25/M40 family metallo-hydrolase, partial [Geobacteraceae bacterium]
EYHGRLAGTEGEARAADYLVRELAAMGVGPASGDSYAQPVEIRGTRFTAGAILSVGELKLRHRIDFGESWITSGGTHEGELLVARDGEDVDAPLAGKFVLIPEKPEGFDLEATVEGGIEQGIAGLLFEEGEPRWFRKSGALTEGLGIPVLRVRKGVAAALAHRAGARVSVRLPVESHRATGSNILGLLDAERPTATTLALTAHYDHIGDDPGGHRYPGALDNATGVSVVLELARELRAERLPYNVLVCFLTGEEAGLLGAKELVRHPPRPLSGVINLDVVGLDPELKQLRIGPVQEENWLPALAQEVLAERGIEARRLKGRDDAAVFLGEGIPTLGLGEYRLHGLGPSIHTPDDRPEAVHVQALAKALGAVREILGRIHR